MIDWEIAGLIAPSHARSATCRMSNYRVSSFQLTRSARLPLAQQASTVEVGDSSSSDTGDVAATRR